MLLVIEIDKALLHEIIVVESACFALRFVLEQFGLLIPGVELAWLVVGRLPESKRRPRTTIRLLAAQLVDSTANSGVSVEIGAHLRSLVLNSLSPVIGLLNLAIPSNLLQRLDGGLGRLVLQMRHIEVSVGLRGVEETEVVVLTFPPLVF